MGIIIDHEKCKAADCKACLNACPKKVLGKFPLDRKKNQLSTRFRIEIVFPEYCESDCVLCQDACREGAVRVDPKIESVDMGMDIANEVLPRYLERIAAFFAASQQETSPTQETGDE